jgi:hypothetical protein
VLNIWLTSAEAKLSFFFFYEKVSGISLSICGTFFTFQLFFRTTACPVTQISTKNVSLGVLKDELYFEEFNDP